MTGDAGPFHWRSLLGAAAALAILGGTMAAAVLLVATLGPWADEDPPASLTATESLAIAAPVPLAAGESYVRTEVLSSGDSVVTQWIESRQLLFGLALASPLADAGETEELVAEKVTVVADGRVVSGPERILAGDTARYSFLGTTSVQIRYRLTGAIDLSDSAPGRALARLTALDLTYEPASTDVTRVVVAPEVLSMACSSPVGQAAPRPCGEARSAGEWTVELTGPFAQDSVMAALTLE